MVWVPGTIFMKTFLKHEKFSGPIHYKGLKQWHPVPVSTHGTKILASKSLFPPQGNSAPWKNGWLSGLGGGKPRWALKHLFMPAY